MKLKTLVVASMSVLGLSLISYPAMAAQKHKHHHVKHNHHHQVAATPVVYKDMGALPTEVCPINDPISLTLDMMDHNTGRAKAHEGCTKMISFAGGVNFDVKWGNRGMGYQGENVSRVSLNDAYLNIFGNVTEWSKAFASISYSNPSAVNAGTSSINRGGQYSNVYSVNNLNLEQGFIRIANFDQSPFFLQLGKQFQDFGRYKLHPIERPMTQVMTETLATSAEAGFVTPMGFHGSVAAFDNQLNGRYSTYPVTAVEGHKKTDYTASLGFDQMNDQLSFGVNVSYIYNLTGVNDVAQAISQYQGGVNATSNGSYGNRVSGVSLDGMVSSGPFSLVGDYVTANTSFSPNDLGNKGIMAVAMGTGNGAKPWTSNLQAGYNFNAWNKDQNVYVGYQASGDAVNLSLPKNRWVVGYNVDVWKSTNLGLELGHDKDYNTSNGGTGNSSNTIGLRAGVQFG